MNDIVLEVLFSNKLTCPECGSKETLEMSTTEKMHIYECASCEEIVQVNDDLCCVHCQYGEVKCPEVQVQLN
tara:strand:- start:5094 stop:5309 length:216 start_codon:yes stop_codon:yes gene_type:complete